MTRSRVSRLFVDQTLERGMTVVLNPSSAHYIRNVLRLKDNDQIALFNGQDDCDHRASINFLGKRDVQVTISDSIVKRMSPPIRTHLLQAVGKSDHIDFICQKATELGVDGIFLFNSERTQTPLKGNRIEKKLTRWRSICISACEQCGRNRVPRVEFCETASAAIGKHSLTNKLLLDFDGQGLADCLDSIKNHDSFSIAIGAEGGFNSDEIEQFNNNGYLSCLAGPRVLRMETAAISILSTLQYQFGDMG